MKNLGTSSEHRTQQSQRKARGGVIVCMGERPYYGRKGVCGVWRVRATVQHKRVCQKNDFRTSFFPIGWARLAVNVIVLIGSS